MNCAGLVQPGFSLLELEGDVYLFGQKGWAKTLMSNWDIGVRIKNGELRLRAISFSKHLLLSPSPPMSCDSSFWASR